MERMKHSKAVALRNSVEAAITATSPIKRRESASPWKNERYAMAPPITAAVIIPTHSV